ncbi:MAG: mannose-1-phosphate guanylyltransferase/mannose-6-phosphate isomerase [Aquificae bacterium]|nr:mannose-1-phosphate guanylyltransferase/mannose-6-phosphate isomerase [Aquificota bacterium]
MKVFILSGGKGTRLWPLSRENFPKQFIRLFSEHSLFQETVKRALRLVGEEDIFVITGEKYEWLIRNELEEIGLSDVNVVVEPAGKNTAPAIALGVKKLLQLETPPTETVLVLPSDHLIKNPSKFTEAVLRGEEVARKDYIVLFGEKPIYPETGYGYIKLGREIAEGVYEVERFEEKPDYEKAREYVNGGRHLWNCGIFLFRLGRIVEDYRRLMPDLDLSLRYEDFARDFPSFPNISFDYAILERTERIAVVRLEAGWSDVGSWKAVYDNLEKDERGNVTIGDLQVLSTENSLILSQGKNLIACVGLEDFVIVGTEDATLVIRKEDAQRVREIVKELEKKGDERAVEHVKSFTPFGSITKLDRGERYRIRKITVKRGKEISLRMHHHRTVHFIILRGTAKVVIGERESFFHENESFFIPKSTPYKIVNVGRIPLEVIEVQSGEYLGEDDVETLE